MSIEVSVMAFDDYGSDWYADISAELGAELQGDAVFVGDDGGDMGVTTSSVILIASGVDTMASLRLRLTSDSDAKLLLRLAADGVSATATVSLRVLDRALQRLHIQAPSEVSPRSPARFYVPVSFDAFDNYGDALLEDVTATLTAELIGDAAFVGAADGETITTSVLSISGGQATRSLRLGLRSDSDARLLLTLAADGVIATATVSLRAVDRALQRLHIQAPSEMLATKPFEHFDVPVSLGAFDNYGDPSLKDVTATLTAELIGDAAFVGAADGETITTSVLSISGGQATRSLRLGLRSDSDARLLLTLAADGVSATATVSLRAVPRVLQRLEIRPLDEAVIQNAGGEKVTVTFEIAAFDNYGDAFATRVALVVQALDSPLAQVRLVGEALSSSGSFLVDGKENVAVEALPRPGRSFSLQLEAHAGGISSRAVTRIVAYTNIIRKTSSPKGIAAVCRVLGLGDEQCAMITSVYSNSDQLWRIGSLSQTGSDTLYGGSAQFEPSSCLRMHVRLAEPQVIDFQMRVDPGNLTAPSINPIVNAMTAELFNANGRFVERRVFEVAAEPGHTLAGSNAVARRAQYLWPTAGEVELRWCETRKNLRNSNPAELVGLRFFAPRLVLEAPASLELTRDGPGVPIALTLSRVLDEDGEDLIVGGRPYQLELNAALSGGAVFVDAAGNNLGTTATDTLSMTPGEVEIPSFRMRATGVDAATLMLTFTAYGLTGAVAAVTLLPAELSSKARICAALDIDAFNCARFVNFSTSGGAGGVTGGIAGDDDALGWSVVEASTATGAAALKSAALGDAEHSCLGFDVHLDERESLAFDWRASSRSGDVLRLWVDGETRPEDAIEGETGEWRRHVREDLAAGDHQIRWCYEKDAAAAFGADAAWLDNVRMGSAKPILTLAHADAPPAAPVPFEKAEMMLTLRLSDRFGRPLPLADLPEAAFPLQVGVSSAGPERLPGLFWRPLIIEYSEIVASSMSYTFRFRAESLVTNNDAPWQVVVATAAGASPALTASLPLEPTPFAQYKRVFCDVTGLDEADCALIEAVHFSPDGRRSWRVQGEGEDREFVSAEVLDVNNDQSCLNVNLNFRRPTLLAADMRVSSKPGDYLIFRLNYAVEIGLSRRQVDRDILIRDRINGRRALAFGKSGDDVRFTRREPLPAGESRVGWCYQKIGDDHLHDDAGYLEGLQFFKMDLALDVSPDVTLPDTSLLHGSAEVPMSIRVTSDDGEAWPEDVVATLGAELQGDAVFVDDAGGALGAVFGDAISIASGVETRTSLRLRLTSMRGARLLLRLAIDGAVTTATVNLQVAPRELRRLDVAVPDEALRARVFEILEVPVALRAFDNFGDLLTKDVTATLTAELSSGSVFVEDGGDAGAMIGRMILIASGQTTTALRMRLTASHDATLMLAVSVDNVIATATVTVSLRAEPGEFRSLQIDAPQNVFQTMPGEVVAVTFELSALDDYGDFVETRVALVAKALDSPLAQVRLVGEALSSSGSFLIEDGKASVVVEALPPPGRSISLQLEARVGDISQRAATYIVARTAIDKTTSPEVVASVCRVLELGDEQCAMITSVYSSAGQPWGIGSLSQASSSTLYGGDTVSDTSGELLSCLSMHVRLAEPQVIDFEMRVDSGLVGPRLITNAMTSELFNDDGRLVERRVLAAQAVDGVVVDRVQYFWPAAGEIELRWCDQRDYFADTNPGELVSLRFFAPRLVLEAPASVELTRDGPGAPIALTLSRVLDEDGEDLIVGGRPYALELNAELSGAAVFVDAAGDDMGTTATDTLSMTPGEAEIPSFRMRSTGAAAATLTLTFTAYGSTGAVAAVTLLPAELSSKAQICAALDIDAFNCARFVNFSTSGGAGGVTGGIAGDNDALAWSVVEASTATGGSALSSAALGDAEHSCLGFDVHLNERESLAFDWYVSSRSGTLSLWVDGETRPEDAIEGETNEWRRHVRELEAGDRQIRWCYEKDAAAASGADAAWLDNVRMGSAKPILTLAHVGEAPAAPAPFERADMMLTLRLNDRFGRELPLADLPASAFPLQVGVSSAGTERLPSIFWRPLDIDSSKIADGAMSYTFRFRAESLVTNNDAPWRVVVATAAGSLPALTASLPLEPTPFAQYRRAFCDVVGLDAAADCARIESIHFTGYKSWFVQGEGENRELVSASDILDVKGQESCMNVKLNFREPTVLVADMRVSSEPSNDYLIFRVNHAAKIELSPMAPQLFREILIEDEINGRRVVAVGKSGDNVRFMRRQLVSAGESRVSWCYQKTGGNHLHDDAGYLLGLQFAEMNLALNVPATVSLPVGATDVAVPIRVTSDDGEFWPEDVVAAFGAELQGDAVFVGDDGGDLGVVSSATISIDAGIEAMMPLRVRLTSMRGARLLLRLAVDDMLTTATVSLQAGIVTQRALLRIDAPLEVSFTEAFETLDVPVSLHAFDDYGGAWAQALPRR